MSALWHGEETLVPDVLRGYRGWQVRDSQLHSTGVSHRWAAPEVSARCLAQPVNGGFEPDCPCDLCRSNTHAPPVRDCTCGIYGWYSPHDTRLVEADVFGVVEATGRVVLASHGFRAEQARILALAIAPLHSVRNPFSASIYSTIYGRELPSPSDLHDLARWAKTQNIPVFRDRTELLTAFPPKDMTALVTHDCDETCHAAEKRPASTYSGTLTFNTTSVLANPSFTASVAEPAAPERPSWKALCVAAACLALVTVGLTMSVVGVILHGMAWSRLLIAVANATLAVGWGIHLWRLFRRRRAAAVSS